MNSRISRQVALGALLVFGSAPAFGQARRVASNPPLTLQEELNAWYRTAVKKAPGEWGVAVADEKGQLVWGIDPTAMMIPASTVKLFTTGFARSVLGSDAHKTTRVVGTGHLDPATGSWLGTWALELNGDPSFERAGRNGARLADLATQLAARGIRHLAGPLSLISATGDAGASFPSAWSSRHRGRLFAPLIGNLTLHENLVSFAVAAGPRAGSHAVLAGASPLGFDQLVRVEAKTVKGRKARLKFAQDADGRVVVTGTIGTSARARGFSAPTTNPRAVLEAAWKANLAAAGIDWTSAPGMSAPTGTLRATTIAEVISPTFDSIASEINRRSLNIGAELLLHWAAGYDNPVDRLNAHVQQITGDRSGVRLVDGSGLSSENRVSPYAFVTYLARFPLAPGGKNFPQLLPANGTGTLWRLASGLPIRGVVRAKTGTLGNVASLVGYLGRSDGVLLVSLMYNGNRVWAARQQQWSLFRTLGASGVVIPMDSLETDHLGGPEKP
ncbi:MAG: D-alanyl-D-alanine carboxypeptidase/D-alanyl-D-alanine-endopeptidase [Gemmatimonadota bacterium]